MNKPFAVCRIGRHIAAEGDLPAAREAELGRHADGGSVGARQVLGLGYAAEAVRDNGSDTSTRRPARVTEPRAAYPRPTPGVEFRFEQR